jgi:hypothetical protein
MTIDWTLILAVAFATIGILEYAKGFFPDVPGNTWRIIQLVACLALAAVFALLPPFIGTGLLALALSQIGYQAVIEAVKRKLA